MANHMVLTSPVHRSVLQPTNNNITEKENQRGVIRRLGKDCSDSESEDWSKSTNRKRRAVPNYVTNADGPHPRRRARPNETLEVVPAPILPSHVIARRNERERNRVRQVNDSFALLRSRIPDYLYDNDSDDSNKGSRKKLSKVETLRLAVDYIQKLEVLLNIKGEHPVLSEDEGFQFGSETQCSSVKTEIESDEESDIMDLRKEQDASPDTTGQVKDDLEIEEDVKQSMEDLNFPSMPATSPLPSISESFSTEGLNLNYSDLYVPYGLVDLTTKCD